MEDEELIPRTLWLPKWFLKTLDEVRGNVPQEEYLERLLVEMLLDNERTK